MRIGTAFPNLLAATLGALTMFPALASAELKLPRVSPRAAISQTLGTTDLTVTYCRPGVKNRVIWGDLVPYGKVWRTGANEVTTISTTEEIQFGGQKLPAGTYALLTIPGKDEWTVVINSDKDQWGSNDYKSEKDILRVQARPTVAEPQEWMEFSFEPLTPNSVNLVLRWERLRLAVPITTDVNGKVLAAARAAIADWRTPYQAASFCLSNDVALDEGKKWLEKSLAMEQNYNNLQLLARWQFKDGHKPEAIETAKKALEAAKASKDKIETEPTEKLLAEWTAKK